MQRLRPALRALLGLGLAASSLAEDYTVRFDVQLDQTRQGSFLITVRESKAPLAAARFRAMVNSGFFNGQYFFRVVPGFIVQFGLSGNLTKQHLWDAKGSLRDESRIDTPDWNMRGTIAFVTSGPNTRGTQCFINYDDNHQLDAKGMVPFGRLVSGMGTLSAVYSGYRERPREQSIRTRGDEYLWSEYPRLSRIISAQQVAFVEEPFAMSKNTTGLLLTLGMVGLAALCCCAMRLLQRRAKALGMDDDVDFRPRADGLDDVPPGDEGRDEAYDDDDDDDDDDLHDGLVK